MGSTPTPAEKRLQRQANRLRRRYLTARRSKYLSGEDLLEQVDDSNPNVVIDDREDVVIMRFTGGTTGRGKCRRQAVYS